MKSAAKNRHLCAALLGAILFVTAVVNSAQAQVPAAAATGASGQERFLARLTFERLSDALESAGFQCGSATRPSPQRLAWLCTREAANAQEHVQIWGRDRSRLTFVGAAVMPLPGGTADPSSLFRLMVSLPFAGDSAEQASSWLSTAVARARSSVRIDGAQLALTRRSGVFYLSLSPA